MTMTREPLHGSHRLATWHIVALTYGCLTCGAMPGQSCVSVSGTARSTEVHTSRTNAAAARQWVAADVPIVCIECGNDEAVDGERFCLDCLEGNDAEE